MKKDIKIRKCILIVDDSKSMRSMLSDIVGSIDDFQIIEAGNGFDAIRLLPRYKFDLIIADINMPDINGLELIGFIKKNKNYKDIPLIIVSTEGSSRDIEKGINLGAKEYIVKPFDPSIFQRILGSYLR